MTVVPDAAGHAADNASRGLLTVTSQPSAGTAVTTPSLILERLGQARVAIATVETVEEAIRLAGFADSVRYAAQQAKAGVDLENAATEVKLRAEKRAGELLTEMEKNTGGQREHESYRSPAGTGSPPTLADLGVSKKQSSAFQQVAAVPEDEFEAYVKAPKERLTRKGLLRKVKKQHKPVAIPPMPDGAWGVLYADPPWLYESNTSPADRAIENHYPTLTTDAICALEPPAAPDAVLFLWATSPKLEEALRVMAAWGFSYRTNLVWVKDRIGMGYYARSRHELLLVGRKGNYPVPAEDARPDSVIEAPRAAHSVKPEIVYDLIESMYPARPWLELFARHERPGWDTWGYDATS